MFDPCRIPGSRSLHERKFATWALRIGETYSSAVHAEVRCKPHRGMLPDVDFSRVVPAPGRPSLVRRLFRLIRPGGASTEAVGAATRESVGETSHTTYIARDKAETPDDSSGEDGFDAVRARAA